MYKVVKKVNLAPGEQSILTIDRETGNTHDLININPGMKIEQMKSYHLDMNTIILPRVPKVNGEVIKTTQFITVIQGKIKLLGYNIDKATSFNESMIAGQSLRVDGKYGIGFRAIIPNVIVLVQYITTVTDFDIIPISYLGIPADEVESILSYSRLE